MTETLTALYFAHVIADFVLQTNWIVQNKRRPLAMGLHAALVWGALVVSLGSLDPMLIGLAAAHLVIDVTKLLSNRRGIWPFLADQAAHGLSLVVLALYAPQLWAQGHWAAFPLIAPLMALAAGAIVATRAGGFAVGMLMEPFAAATRHGLPGGGQVIGNLERGLIFLLMLTGQAQGIGFLIAAKSVLRFGTVGDDRAISEYVIIGTMASVGWAIAASMVTLLLLRSLAPLGIPDLTP